MARPNKQGIDYFSLDVTLDDKFELIEAKHGLIGFGIVIKIFQKIYKEGYYMEWNEEKLLLLKKGINVDINSINVVLADSLAYGIFYKPLFDEYQILTSKGIQKRFLKACERRKGVEMDEKLVIVNINDYKVDINWINTYISTQSKVKESKVKESKVNKNLQEVEKLEFLQDPEPEISELDKIITGNAKKINGYESLSEEKKQVVCDLIKRIKTFTKIDDEILASEIITFHNKELYLEQRSTAAKIKDVFYYCPNEGKLYSLLDNIFYLANEKDFIDQIKAQTKFNTNDDVMEWLSFFAEHFYIENGNESVRGMRKHIVNCWRTKPGEKFRDILKSKKSRI